MLLEGTTSSMGKGFSRYPFWSRGSFNQEVLYAEDGGGRGSLAAVATGSISKLVFSCSVHRERGCRRVPGETHRGQARVEPGDT